MAEATVTVGDTEVEIRETDDGFEAVEADPSPEPGVYIRAEDQVGNYGFEIPLDEADAFVVEYDPDRDGGKNPYYAAWDTTADVSDMSSSGHSGAEKPGYDGYAVVGNIEIVERR